MSMGRLNFLATSGVLPFNFGMDYDAWVKLYEKPALRGLVGSDPATWTAEEIEETNKLAKEETELCDRLMAIRSDEEFYAEVKRLQKEADDNPDQATVHPPDHQPEPPPLRAVGGEHAG